MQTTNEIVGGIFILIVITLILGFFGIKRKIGFFGVFIIGAGLGILISTIAGVYIGMLAGIIASLISIVASSKKNDEPKIEINTYTPPVNNVSVADELLKLNELKDKKVISETEFYEQKAKLLSK